MIETIQLKLKGDSFEAVRSISFKDYLYYRHVEQSDILRQFLEEMWEELSGSIADRVDLTLLVRLNDLESQELVSLKEHEPLNKEALIEFLLRRVDAMWDGMTQGINES